MGSFPRLKIKDELRYRRGPTNESLTCRFCSNFMEDIINDGSRGIGKYSMRWPGVCKLMVGYFSRGGGNRTLIFSDHTCDAQKFDEAKKTWGRP